jgi:hypothetical protein
MYKYNTVLLARDSVKFETVTVPYPVAVESGKKVTTSLSLGGAAEGAGARAGARARAEEEGVAAEEGAEEGEAIAGAGAEGGEAIAGAGAEEGAEEAVTPSRPSSILFRC